MAEKSKPSPVQRIVDAGASLLGGPSFGPSLVDVLTKRLLKDEDDDWHPKNERRGSFENIVKFLGKNYGTLISPDLPYLEQYLHPESDVLPLTPKPSDRPGTLPYREPHYEDPGIIREGQFIPTKDSDYQVVNREGLGAHSMVDATGYPSPYGGDYVYDVWDFETPHGMLKDDYTGNSKPGVSAGELIKKVMQYVGKPYAIFGPERKPRK
jgi:hypothetical protein